MLAEIPAEFRRKRPGSSPGPEEMRMSPETFRNRALECARLAQHASDAYHRSLLLGMAESWTVLARSAEEMERYVDGREGANVH